MVERENPVPYASSAGAPWPCGMQEEQREVAAVAPQLLPLWQLVGPERLGARGPYAAREVLHVLKATVLNLGLSPVAWRYTCRLPQRFAWILFTQRHGEFRQMLERANFLAAVGEVPASEPVFVMLVGLAKKVAACAARRRHAAAFARVAIGHLPARPNPSCIAIVFGVFQWFECYVLDGGTALPFDRNQQRAPFSWYLRQARACGLVSPETDELPSRWESLVGPFRYYGFDVIPLLLVAELRVEGDDMWNCVRRYAPKCARGVSRIFSIRLNGQVHATLELAKYYGDWRLEQVRCFRNTPAGPVEKIVAREVLRRYQEAWRRRCGETGSV